MVVQEHPNRRGVAKKRRLVEGRLPGGIPRIHVPSDLRQVAERRYQVLEVPIATGVQNRIAGIWISARFQKLVRNAKVSGMADRHH